MATIIDTWTLHPEPAWITIDGRFIFRQDAERQWFISAWASADHTLLAASGVTMTRHPTLAICREICVSVANAATSVRRYEQAYAVADIPFTLKKKSTGWHIVPDMSAMGQPQYRSDLGRWNRVTNRMYGRVFPTRQAALHALGPAITLAIEQTIQW